MTELVTKIEELRSQKKSLIIGIDGISGSGKSSLALSLKNELENTKIIKMDDFWNEELKSLDNKLLAEQNNLNPLTGDQTANYLQYYKNILNDAKRELKPDEILIIEGVFALHSSIENYYNYKIWIETKPQTVGQKTDQLTEDNLEEKENKNLSPEEKDYLEQDNPKERADLVITNNFHIPTEQL